MIIYHLIIVSNGDWSLMRVKESDALGVSFKSAANDDDAKRQAKAILKSQ